MASNADFSDYQNFATSEEPPRQRGCFFYGCLIAIVLSLLLLIAVGVIFFILYRFLNNVVQEYTAEAPRELPRVEMPADRVAALKGRVEAFNKAVEGSRPTEPLVLSADELNALIQEDPNLNGRIHVAIDGDKLKGEVSIPLSQIPAFGLTQGRYLNGEAELKASLQEGLLIVTLESLEVNGKAAPPEFLNSLRNQNLVQGMYKDARKAEEMRKYQSLEIKDGKVILKARDPTRGAEEDRSEAPSRVEARDGRAIVHPPREKAPPELPEDVLAPPGSRPAVPIEPSGAPRTSPK